MNRWIAALAFVCVILASALVAVMNENDRLKTEVRDLKYFTSPERMKRRLHIDFHINGDTLIAEAQM